MSIGALVFLVLPLLVGVQSPEQRAAPSAEPCYQGAPAAGTPIYPPPYEYYLAPTLINRREVGATMEREYPPLLRDAGVEGSAMVWLYIDEAGVVQNAQIFTSSGREVLDEAALRVGCVMRFNPAMNGDQIVPVWVSIPITFSA